MKKKQVNCLIGLLALSTITVAQTTGFSHKATLPPVGQAGFYTVAITPPMAALSKADLSDLRVINDSGRWIPHVLSEPAFAPATDRKINLSFNLKEATGSSFLFIRTDSNRINNLNIQVKNTDAYRSYAISGSDDDNNWYVVTDSITVTPAVAAPGVAVFQLQFPTVSYRQLRVTIYHPAKAPLNVLQVTTAVTAVTKGLLYLDNPAPVIRQLDSGKVSYIRIVQAAAYPVSQLKCALKGSPFYKRTAALYLADTIHAFDKPGRLLAQLLLVNGVVNYEVPLSKGTVYYLLVQNEDNPPLQVKSLMTASPQRYITTYLEPHQTYSIYIGNPLLKMPAYDLTASDIHENSVLEAAAPEKLPTAVAVDRAPATFTGLIWVLLGLAALVIAFFTAKLAREMNKRSR